MAIALGFGGVLLLGSYWVLEDRGIITVGELVFFSMMIQRLLWPLTRMGVTLDEFERAKASAIRTFGILEAPSEIVSPAVSKSLPRPVQGRIEMININFNYRRGGEVLKGLNLSVEQGEMIGIAGVTGAGKSTLIKLLLRFYDPTSGQVILDGIDLRELKLNEVRKQISLVSQDVYLFHGTIGENIAYGTDDLDIRKIEEASLSAQLHEFVQTLSDGYKTIVGERGIRLSGGQRQRLSIARAILKNSPLMIFDAVSYTHLTLPTKA